MEQYYNSMDTEERKDICIKQFIGGEVVTSSVAWKMRGVITSTAEFVSINAENVHVKIAAIRFTFLM